MSLLPRTSTPDPLRSPEHPLRVMLVDDHPILREGLRAQLEAVKHFCIVAEACNAQEALSRARELKPELAVIDIGLPDMDGIELTRMLLTQVPGIAVLILSMYDDDEYVCRAIRAG